MSRKSELGNIAAFLGNAAAHAALLPEDSFAQKEVSMYSSDASGIFLSKHWNEKELSYLRNKAFARAKSEIKRRIVRYGFEEKHLEKFVKVAEEYIVAFITQAK